MEINIHKGEININTPVVFSPYWNEFYVDGAFITVDDSAIRIAFVNHLPQYSISVEQNVNLSRKVDVVMSENSFNDLFSVMMRIKQQIEPSKDKE